MWQAALQAAPAIISGLQSLFGGDDDDAPDRVMEQKHIADPQAIASMQAAQNAMQGIDPNIAQRNLPGLSGLQQLQMGQTGDMAGYNPEYFRMGMQGLQSAGQPLEQRAGELMNPYTQNVLNEQMRLSNQNLFEGVLPQVNSTFAGAGQFGSTRNADFMNRAIRDQGYNLAGQMGNTLMNSQNAANQLAMGDLQRQAGLAGQAFGQGMTGLSALGGAGSVQRQESDGGVQDTMFGYQQDLQNKQNEFLKAQGLGNLAGQWNTITGGGTTVGTMYGDMPSPQANIGAGFGQGMYGGLASLGNMFSGGSQGTPNWFGSGGSGTPSLQPTSGVAPLYSGSAATTQTFPMYKTA